MSLMSFIITIGHFLINVADNFLRVSRTLDRSDQAREVGVFVATKNPDPKEVTGNIVLQYYLRYGKKTQGKREASKFKKEK